MDFEKDLVEQLKVIRDLLIAKNRKYGDAALNPKRVFAKADPIELINIRIDDKLNRIMNQQSDEDEDAELDLIGYLLLKRIAKKRLQDGKATTEGEN